MIGLCHNCLTSNVEIIVSEENNMIPVCKDGCKEVTVITQLVEFKR